MHKPAPVRSLLCDCELWLTEAWKFAFLPFTKYVFS